MRKFTEACRKAMDHFKKNYPQDLFKVIKAGNPAISDALLWYQFRGYILALGVSRKESWEAAHFAMTHNFWYKE